jgi:crotonobetainyl-CoA:carnitine CoA-transferase CaiB-like acyl-CoA transferase
MRPLDGLLVLDFSTLLPGPMATLVLQQAGARVLKIERPGTGEDMRGYAPQWGDSSINFAMLNAGKESLALDLKDSSALAALRPLIEKADIVVEQFRPGVMTRLGLDYATLSAINPQLIYCSITGYGQSGPRKDFAAHDLNYIAETGLLGLSMGTPQSPVLPPALVADIAAGAYPALFNILLALHQRTMTGRGCYLDVAMTDNLFIFMYWAIGNHAVTGRSPANGGELVTGGSPRYNLYPTRDGKMVAAAPIEQKFWDNFCALIGLEAGFRDDAAAPEATRRRIGELILQHDASYWEPRFEASDCCCVVVRTIAEALNDPHFKSRGLFDARIRNAAGAETSALPVPLVRDFRPAPDSVHEIPSLGGGNVRHLAG